MEFVNLVVLNFDSCGRLWVFMMFFYLYWKLKMEFGDKLLIFEDYDGDGVVDECKVFVDGLY